MPYMAKSGLLILTERLILTHIGPYVFSFLLLVWSGIGILVSQNPPFFVSNPSLLLTCCAVQNSFLFFSFSVVVALGLSIDSSPILFSFAGFSQFTRKNPLYHVALCSERRFIPYGNVFVPLSSIFPPQCFHTSPPANTK